MALVGRKLGGDPTALAPVLLVFDSSRVTQKAKYLSEMFLGFTISDGDRFSFLEFFQTDRKTGGPKGIAAINLGELG